VGSAVAYPATPSSHGPAATAASATTAANRASSDASPTARRGPTAMAPVDARPPAMASRRCAGPGDGLPSTARRGCGGHLLSASRAGAYARASSGCGHLPSRFVPARTAAPPATSREGACPRGNGGGLPSSACSRASPAAHLLWSALGSFLGGSVAVVPSRVRGRDIMWRREIGRG
jgi:hypothetical protein